MPSALFTRWKAYANHEPFGYQMDNFRMGVPAAAIANTINGTIDWKRKPRKVKPSDFYPEQDKPAPELTPEQQAHIRKKRAKKK